MATKKNNNRNALSGMLSSLPDPVVSERVSSVKASPVKPKPAPAPTVNAPAQTIAKRKPTSIAPNRTRFSIYAKKESFEKVDRWAAHLDVSKADIIERALDLYCTQLADQFNKGKELRATSGQDSPLP